MLQYRLMAEQVRSLRRRNISVSLQWRHDGHDNVSNHQPHHCLLSRLLGADQRKHQSSASLTGEFPAQMASNAENVSIWWRHHVHRAAVETRDREGNDHGGNSLRSNFSVSKNIQMPILCTARQTVWHLHGQTPEALLQNTIHPPFTATWFQMRRNRYGKFNIHF